jgi:Raf kinase inhibitor-like YbhB/YbcL family protein
MRTKRETKREVAMAGIELHSSSFSDDDLIPHRHGRDGDNVSPHLEWSGVPSGAAELVLLCEDPDAPTGTFMHWLVTGIDPASHGMDPGQVPKNGSAWPNDFGELGWGGPQPPVGYPAHRYLFHLFALSEPVSLPAEPTAGDVHDAVRDITLASGVLVGIFAR